MYGWRARIGVLIPHINAVAEAEFWRLAPQGVSVHTARMRLPELTTEGLIAMGQEIERAALELAELNASVICFCCTSGSFVKGVGYDRELMERIQKATDIPAISTSFATVEALRFLGVKRVAVATPYADEINTRIVNFFEGNKFQVTSIRGLGIGPRQPYYPFSSKPISHIGLQEPSIAYRLAKEAMSKDAEGIFISCTNFRALDAIDLLERDLGVPIVTANQATFWSAIRTAGIRESISGYGMLLQRLANE